MNFFILLQKWESQIGANVIKPPAARLYRSNSLNQKTEMRKKYCKFWRSSERAYQITKCFKDAVLQWLAPHIYHTQTWEPPYQPMQTSVNQRVWAKSPLSCAVSKTGGVHAKWLCRIRAASNFAQEFPFALTWNVWSYTFWRVLRCFYDLVKCWNLLQ